LIAWGYINTMYTSSYVYNLLLARLGLMSVVLSNHSNSTLEHSSGASCKTQCPTFRTPWRVKFGIHVLIVSVIVGGKKISFSAVTMRQGKCIFRPWARRLHFILASTFRYHDRFPKNPDCWNCHA